MKEITPRQQELLEYLFEGLKTFKDMREHLGVTSNQTVSDILNLLVINGYIENVNRKYVPLVSRCVERTELPLKDIPNANAYMETITYKPTTNKEDKE